MVRISRSVATVASLSALLAFNGVAGGSVVAAHGVTKPAKIDFGLYCNAKCQKALTLHASPASVKCSVGFALDATSFPYGVAMKSGMAAAAKRYFPNMKLSIIDGQNNTTVQSNAVDTFITKKVKVLIINAVVAASLAPAVQRAEKAGIKVIAVDRTVSAPVLTTIKADDLTLGQVAGRYVAQRLHGKGNIVELSGTPGASPTIDRHAGFMSVIKKYPGIHVIASETANYDRGQGLKVMEDILQRFPAGSKKIDGVFTHNDEMSLGALQAITAAGRQKEISVFSIDGEQQAFDSIQHGGLASTVVYPVVVPMGVVAAAKACVGEKMPKRITLDAPLITKANVQKYMGTTYP